MHACKLTLRMGVAVGAMTLASLAAAQTTPGDQSGTPTAAGAGQSAASSTNAPATAAAPAAPGPAAGSDIIVTARRVEERLQDVPISITVLNQQQITERNIVQATDLATYVPSLAAQNRFGSENASFAIRGFTQEVQTAPSVGIYFADVIAPRVQAGTQAGNGAGPGSFFDLQNVQVLKGPQGTLFGRNTTGGAVLLVPQKPTGRLEGYVEGSVGNYDMRRIQAVLNAPLTSWARFRVGVDRQTRDGFEHNISGIGPKDYNDIDYWAVRASLVLDLTPDLENYTIGSLSNSDSHGYYPKVAVCDPAGAGFLEAILGPLACRQIARTPGYYTVLANIPNPRDTVHQRQVINTTTWRVSDTLTLKNIASYGTFTQRQNTNIFGDYITGPATLPLAGRNFPFLAAGQPFDFVQIFNDKPNYNSSGQTFVEEFQIQGSTGDSRLTYQAGVYYERTKPFHGFQAYLTPTLLSCTDLYAKQCSDPIGNLLTALTGRQTPVGQIQNSRTKYWFTDIGVYAQATYKISDKLSVTGGIRYTHDKERSLGQIVDFRFPTPNNPVAVCAENNTVSANNPAVCNLSAQQKSGKPTWLIDLDYKPADDVLFYGKYARGYRAGGVNTSNPGLGETWGPEKLESYEIGAKVSFSRALRGYFNVAGFYNDLSNQQLLANAVAIPPQGPVAAIVNAGKSRIKGIEVDSSITPVTGLTLAVAYTYLDAKLRSFSAPAFDTTKFTTLVPTAAVGGPLILSPKNRVTATASYELPLPSDVGRVSVGATLVHTDKQLAGNPTQTPIATLPSTNLLNLNLSWNKVAGTPIDLSVFATNVTNRHYPVFVGQIYQTAAYDTINQGEPRIYGARLRYTFGR